LKDQMMIRRAELSEVFVSEEVVEEYDGPDASEAEASDADAEVSDDAESVDEGSDAENGEDMDLTDNKPVEMAAANRPTRRPRIEYAGLKRNSSDGKAVATPRLAKLVHMDRKGACNADVDYGANGTLEEWYHEQECVFGIAGYGEYSNVIMAPLMPEKFGDASLIETEMEHEEDPVSMPCISVVKRKSRTEMNPTVTVAFKTEEGTAKWTPSVVKELTVLGPMNKFAMVLLEENQIP